MNKKFYTECVIKALEKQGIKWEIFVVSVKNYTISDCIVLNISSKERTLVDNLNKLDTLNRHKICVCKFLLHYITQNKMWKQCVNHELFS